MNRLVLPGLLLAMLSCQHQPEPQTTSTRTNDDMPMCHDGSATARFAALADDPAFINAHPDPLAVEAARGGEMVEFPVEGGANGHAFLVKSKKKTNKYLLVFQEYWGLNDYVKNESVKWSRELGVNVLALDLYDGKVGKTAEEAGALMKANDPARSQAIIKGGIKYAGDAADFRTLGWCFGGGWSLQAALALGSRLKGCVMYYGMPEKDVQKLKTLNSDVLFVHADQDKWINEDVVKEFEKNMKAAGKTLKVAHYDADHAFANPSSPHYDKPDAKAARMVVKDYLKNR